jgi:uncharacterized membrane protein
MYRSIRFLGLVLIMLLALYPIAELTRVILVSGEYYFPEMKGQFGAEITIMWAMYVSIIPVFLLLTAHRVRRYQKQKRELLKHERLESNDLSLQK